MLKGKRAEFSFWSSEQLNELRGLKEEDKLSDIEKQPPFGDRKYSNTLPQKRGGGA